MGYRRPAVVHSSSAVEPGQCVIEICDSHGCHWTGRQVATSTRWNDSKVTFCGPDEGSRYSNLSHTCARLNTGSESATYSHSPRPRPSTLHDPTPPQHSLV